MLPTTSRRVKGLRASARLAMIRDVVEIIAIISAGIWAFYVFAYDNAIKPSMASPAIEINASLRKLSARNGLIAVGLHTEFRNIGAVRAHFLAVATNVYGQRVVNVPNPLHEPKSLRYEFTGHFRTTAPVPVYAYAYVTHLGDSTTHVDMALDPGTSVDTDRTFYVEGDRYDVLSVGIDVPYVKYDSGRFPTRIVTMPNGAARVIIGVDSSEIEQYNMNAITSLDLR